MITVKQLKRLIKESAEMMEVNRDSFIKQLKRTVAEEPDDVAEYDYVDAASGEVLWEEGQTAHEALMRQDSQYRKQNTPVEPQDIFIVNALNEMEDEYNVEFKTIEDIVDDPKGLVDGDYDVYVSIPYVVSRRDNAPFSDQDVENVDQYLDEYNAEIMPQNIRLTYYGEIEGKKSVKFDIQLQ